MFTFMKNDLSIIPLATVLAYGMSYFYHFGVADYYGYPSIFIVNDLNSFFNAIFGLGLFIFCSLFILLLLSWANNINKGVWFPITILISTYMVAYLFFVGFDTPSSVFPEKGSITILTVMAFVFWPINFFNIYSIVINRKINKEAQDYLSGKTKKFKIRENIKYLTKNQLIMFSILLIAMILSISYSSGKLYSYMNKDLYKLQDDEKTYILNSFSDRIILGSCTKNQVTYTQMKIEDRLIVEKIEDETKVKLIKHCFELRGKNTE